MKVFEPLKREDKMNYFVFLRKIVQIATDKVQSVQRNLLGKNWQFSWVSSMSALQWDYLVAEDQKLFLDSIVVWDRQYSCLGKGQQIPLGPLLEQSAIS